MPRMLQAVPKYFTLLPSLLKLFRRSCYQAMHSNQMKGYRPRALEFIEKGKSNLILFFMLYLG